MISLTPRQRSMSIAATGTIIEWFDFSLFFYIATALSTTFYPHNADSLPIVLATGAIGFLFRPLGAVVFGHIGDTRGRTTALVLSAALMAVAMLGIAIMPGYDQIGVWGGIGVLAMRALAGFSVGAEYTGIMVYLTESAKPNRRGLAASWAAANSEVGALLAVASASITSHIFGSEQFLESGWRYTFLLGAILAAGMIPLRRFMVESPSQHSSEAHVNSTNQSPVRSALTHQRRPIFVAFLISTVGSATYFLTITYLPTYMESVHKGSTQNALDLGTVAAVAAIIITPFIGLAADFFGRRKAFIGTLIAVVVCAIPGYSILGSASQATVFIGVAILAMTAAAWSAIAASAVPEQFTVDGRYSGMAIGYNVATVLFGGFTPAIVSWLTSATSNALTPAYYASIITLGAGIPAIIMMRNRFSTPPEPAPATSANLEYPSDSGFMALVPHDACARCNNNWKHPRKPD